MADPYIVLQVPRNAEDEVIRRRYLEAVRDSPPDRCPEGFQRLRDAYDRIKDEKRRLAFLLFDAGQGESIDELIEEEKCRTSRKRVTLSKLLDIVKSQEYRTKLGKR